MAARISVNKTGCVVGILIGGWHLAWALLVALGWAQPLIDFIFWLHFIKPVYVIEPFSAPRALGLILLTAVLGYVIGSLFALMWNRLHR